MKSVISSLKKKAGLLTQSNIYLFRIIRMLGDFQQHGVVLRRYQRSLSKVNNSEYLFLLKEFEKYCQLNDYAKSTQKSYSRTAENFLSFVEGNKIILSQLNATHLNDFVKTLLGYSKKW